MKVDAIIIGAGISGLTAAIYLKRAGQNVLLFDSADRVGGKVRSEKIEGFILDYGFQVLLTEYPEVKELLNLERLRVRKFQPGTYIYTGTPELKLLADPSRLPKELFSTLFNGIGSINDKFKLWSLKRRLKHFSVADIFLQPELSTAEIVKQYGFSNSFIEQFIRPFFGGILMDFELKTSRRMFDFYLKMLCEGNAVIPENGIEDIPRQLSSELAPHEMGLNTRVAKIDGDKVILESGMEFSAPSIIIASNNLDGIAGLPVLEEVKERCSVAFYYKYSHSPFDEAFVAINAEKGKLINHLAVITDVSHRYSYTSDALISVTVINDRGLSDDILSREVKKELKEWFGPGASYWELIKFYRITHAVPVSDAVSDTLSLKSTQVRPGLFHISDYALNGSLNGALAAGKQIAQHITNERPLQARVNEVNVVEPEAVNNEQQPEE